MLPSLAAFGGILGFLGVTPAVPAQTRTLRQTILGDQIPPRPYQRHPDTCPVDYAEIVRNTTTADELGPLATLKPSGMATPTVALVGGGIANIIAAYELSRVGIKTTLYEEADVLGGRLFTATIAKQASELGAMRFPDRGLFWHYVGLWAKYRGNTLDNVSVNPFPNPGTVPTLVTYQGQTVLYENLPPIFTEIRHLFKEYLNNLNDGAPEGQTVYYGDVVLALQTAPDADSNNQIESFWKAMIARFDGKSFGDILQREVFAGVTNLPDFMAAFGTLGVGTGGFGPLYEIAMLDLLRILLWQYHAEFSLPTAPNLDVGLQGFAEAMANLAFETRLKFDSSATFDQMFQLNSKVANIVNGSSNNVAVTVQQGANAPVGYLFDYAIVGMTTRAMQRIGIELQMPDGVLNPSQSNAVTESVQAAIRRLNLISAYKMFLPVPSPTSRQDWPKDASGNPIVSFLTDEMPRASYVLPPTAGNMVTTALVSYAWGTDALKYEQMKIDERQQVIAASYIYGADSSIPGPSTKVFGTILQTAADSIEVTWNLMPGYGGGFKLDKPEDNYFTNSLFYHYQLAGTFGPGNAGTRVFFAGDSVGHLGGWVEGAAMSAINAVVGVCSMVAHSGASLEFRDASVQFLLDPASNLFHQYKFLGGHEPEVTGLLEMHRLGSCSGDPRCPPSSWVFNGEVPTAAADDSFPSVSVSSDGNYAAVARRAGGVWLQRRDAVNGWQAPIQIPGITSIALPIALDSLPLVNGTSSQLQLLFIDGNSRNLFHGIRGADNTWSAFRSPWSNTASDCDIALDGQALQVVVKDSQGYLRHGIRFPDGSWSPLNYPPAPGGGYFLVQSVSIGCTSLNVDIATIAVTDNNGAVWVAMRFGKQPDGPWSPWEMLPAPAGVTAQATEVAVVVLDDDNQAQLVAAFGNDAVYTSTRYSTNGPSEGEWTAFRRVPYPIGGTGRVARDLCVTRLNGPCDPTFSTAIFADVYAA